ncbi:MAG: type II toxin-antitoxin system HipA family toxin [Solobacterium sp.]|nr:type II toxin-antitoxin system HipA family toxin [Solobacterium sp.]
MKKIPIHIEINGEQNYVGDLIGNTYEDTVFTYADEYIHQNNAHPISISLPLQDQAFTVKKTKNFFDGLLPEGFVRRSIAQAMKIDENDYVAILEALGNECLGAIKVGNAENEEEYQLMNLEDVKALAKEGTTQSIQLVTKAHLSLTGASGKVGLYYDYQNHWYLPIGEAPSTHIVKQSHVRLQNIVTNEQLCLLTANKLGIKTPKSFIVNTGNGKDEDILFASERYDRKITKESRKINGLLRPYRLHQEDFAQALGIGASEKYEKDIQQQYLKKIFELIARKSTDPFADQLKMIDIILFNYFIGNNDGHIKNNSLLYNEDLSEIRLAPAYDIVSTAIYPTGTKEMAFNIGGEYDFTKLNSSSFEKMAHEINVGEKFIFRRFHWLKQHFNDALYESANELMEKGFDNSLTIADQIMHCGGIAYYHE